MQAGIGCYYTGFFYEGDGMKEFFEQLNSVLSIVSAMSDFLWEFPTNWEWYKAVPVFGSFSLAVIVLVGTGIYFSLRLGFIQVRQFKRGLHLLVHRRAASTGISPLAAFFLSSAMRVGPGNILGVTGAISVGGPGALFWMWVSAFFGMAMAYTEATLAQLCKEQKGGEFVGGMPFYGRRLLGNKAWIGTILSGVYIFYAMFCLPAQSFNVVSSIGAMGELAAGHPIAAMSPFYVAAACIVLLVAAVMAFGGIKRVSSANNKLVPVMAVVYVVTVLALVFANVNSVPYFFIAVLGGAFQPDAVFGGLFGTVLVQGIKRGLMSNEAGQGTITMSAAAADARHPCEQGMIAALGVLLDTHVICTMTGFVVIMAHAWTAAPEAWAAAGQLPKFLLSVHVLTPAGITSVILFLLALCFGLFAYTTMIGMITFSEIAVNRISRSRFAANFVRSLGIVVSAFGITVQLAGYDLSNLWAFSDLANIVLVYINVPLLYLGFRHVLKATAHYTATDGSVFSETVTELASSYWRERPVK